MTTLPSCLRQATVSRGGDRALVAAKPVCPPLRSSRLDRSACVSSSHTSASHLRGSPETAHTMRRFQLRKRQRAHRALCKKALAHPRRGGQNVENSFRLLRRHLPRRGRQGKSALLTPYTGRAMKKTLARPLHRGGYGRRRKSGNDLSQSKAQALLRTRIPRLYNPPASLCSAPSLTQGGL